MSVETCAGGSVATAAGQMENASLRSAASRRMTRAEHIAAVRQAIGRYLGGDAEVPAAPTTQPAQAAPACADPRDDPDYEPCPRIAQRKGRSWVVLSSVGCYQATESEATSALKADPLARAVWASTPNHARRCVTKGNNGRPQPGFGQDDRTPEDVVDRLIYCMGSEGRYSNRRLVDEPATTPTEAALS